MPFSVPENKIGYGRGLSWKELGRPEVFLLSVAFLPFALPTGENTCNQSVGLAFHIMKTFFLKLSYLQKELKCTANNCGFAWV